MMKARNHILCLMCMLSVMITAGCRGIIVHEYPGQDGGEIVDPTLINLNIRITPCPLFSFSEDAALRVETSDYYPESEHSVRYLLELRVNESFNTDLVYREIITTTEDHLQDVIERSFSLHALHYKVLVWQDLTDSAAPEADYWFHTSPLTAIKVYEKNLYAGGGDSKQVSSAGQEMDLSPYMDDWNINLDIEVPLIRPESKYIIVSSDLQKFTKSYIANYPTKAELTPEQIFEKCKMRVVYNGYLPTGYNVSTGLLNDSQGGYGYDFEVKTIGNEAAIVAFDYVLTGPTPTSVNVGLVLYGEDGAVLNSVSSINVPLTRNKITVVSGEYLTREYGGGVGIDSDFDGEFNIIVP